MAVANGRGKMQKPVYQNLFKPLNLNGLRLKNRITMAPLYLGYAAEGGRMARLLLHYYNEMAKSGAAMIMVEKEITISKPISVKV